MTDRLYQRDSYLGAFDARVTALRPDGVVLDRTAFFPRARPELFKLETGFRHDMPELRLVDILGFDVQADGGCHVASLKEVGRLVLTKCENKGKVNRRVYFILEEPVV